MNRAEVATVDERAMTGCEGCNAGRSMPASGIGRRVFIAQGALMAAAAALVACGVGENATAPSSLSGTTTIKLSDQPSLASVGGIALVTIQSSPFAVVRIDPTTFVALSRICPHQGSTVNVSASGFLCPNHGAQFNASGTWTGGERTSSLHSYATSYDAVAGTITVG